MAANDAFTAGVRPGGLTNSTEIRLLLCYLVKNAGPITRTEIENALMEERSQTWARKEAEYSARISEKADGHCSVRCQVKALDSELFCLDIGTPDRLSAEMVKKQFILKGNEIYQMLLTKLTEEEK